MNRLKDLRISRNLTLRELGEKTNINFSSLGKLERGDANFTQQQIEILTSFFNVSADYLLGLPTKSFSHNSGLFKPVKILGSVIAGIPIEMNDHILGELDAKVNNPNDYFYLIVKGDSMSPTFEEGDYVLVKSQKTAENNQIVVVGLNGNEAAVKRYKVFGEEGFLFSDNNNYEPIKLTYDMEPHIMGVVEGYYRTNIKK